jgi:hypothetical protein
VLHHGPELYRSLRRYRLCQLLKSPNGPYDARRVISQPTGYLSELSDSYGTRGPVGVIADNTTPPSIRLLHLCPQMVHLFLGFGLPTDQPRECDKMLWDRSTFGHPSVASRRCSHKIQQRGAEDGALGAIFSALRPIRMYATQALQHSCKCHSARTRELSSAFFEGPLACVPRPQLIQRRPGESPSWL